jgi:hypothetical protein
MSARNVRGRTYNDGNEKDEETGGARMTRGVADDGAV